MLQAVNEGTKLRDFAAQGQNAVLFGTQGLFQVGKNAQDITQLAFHGKRTFGALLAASNRYVVEALTRLRREEEGIRVLQCQTAADA